MVESSKAIAANTDLSSAQAFIFRGAQTNFALIISGSYEDVFLKIKQAVLEVEPLLHDEDQTIPLKFTQLHDDLAEKLRGVEELQVMVTAWSEDILYIQSRGHYYAILYRDSKPINLITAEQYDQLVSGHILPGDKILFGTQSLNELTDRIDTDNKQLEFLIKDPIADFQDQLNALILDKPHLDPVAAILLEVRIPRSEKLTNPDPFTPENFTPNRAKAPIFKFHLPHISLPLDFKLPNTRLTLPIIGLILLILISAFIFIRFNKKPSPTSNITQSGPNPADSSNNQSTSMITDWPLYLSLDLIKDKFATKRLSESINNFLLFDHDAKTLVLLSKKLKTNQILGGSRQIGSALTAAINGDFVFSYSPDKGVVRIDIQNQSDTPVVKPDPEWGMITDIFGFGGNFYLLDSAKNQIWKYIPVAAGYSDKVPYFKIDSNVNLRDASRLQIDSSVWALKGNSEIDRYTSGVADFYSIGGLDEPIKSISAFFVSDNTDNVYILDPENSRLVVTDKSGKYSAQYTGDKFKTADDLVADEQSKKLYLLEGNKIYLVDLK